MTRAWPDSTAPTSGQHPGLGALNLDVSPLYGAKRMPAPFVGRKAELATIDRLLEELQTGRGGAVALVGEPGIGKTRLLGELIGSADIRGYLALSGTASELDRDVPFWVVADALEEYVRGLAPTVLEPLGLDVLADLAQVLPLINSAVDGRERTRDARALPEPSSGAPFARAPRREPAARSRPRRPALGGLRLVRVATRPPSPAAGCAGPDRSRFPAASLARPGRESSRARRAS